jgi:hypothetical protein
MEWLPGASVEMLKTAVPDVRATVPKVVEPSLIVTFPDGVNEEEELGLTVTVKLTCCPNMDGLTEATRAVTVAAAEGPSLTMNASLPPPFAG